ncbi:alpha/beta hydrolase domain-containing protein [Alcanivorax sp. S71-1-4]|uniref:alpha/beta hydrolase n=1 Tax=Alcanivorax sp. S71-1-4 TaxID=1177159 RepID=UPI0013587C8E|nr:alpha/beta hydrolase [Alcanivorax sp. S71-1-4]KAF0810689.1 alpha/beta hydrolase domain-containing protein [Alcanivorax sp. S71-1-4]
MTTTLLPADTRRGQQLAAAALRLALRTLVKPMFHPAVPVTMLRRGLRLSALTTLTARGVERSAVSLDGVPAEYLRVRDSEPARALLYLHGGAYVVGGPGTHRALTSHLAQISGAGVFVADYRLAPEHPFPAAQDDAVTAYQGLLAQGYAPENILIGGDSAGGGLTLSTALRLRDSGLPLPAGLILISPWADLTHPAAQHARQPDEVMLSWRTLEHAADLYAPARRELPYVSPLRADLRGLPPCLTIGATDEILADDTLRLTEALASAGVAHHTVIYQTMWHVFAVHAGVLSSADDAIARMAAFIQRGLQ